MDEKLFNLYEPIAKLRNIRSELIALGNCQAGMMEPLLCVLKEYGLPNRLALDICWTIKHPEKPKRATKRNRIGLEVEQRLRRRPGEKEKILGELARQNKITEKTVENYHSYFLKKVIERPGPTRADLEQARTEFHTLNELHGLY